MYGVYNTEVHNYDNNYKPGKQLPKTVKTQMIWTWMGKPIPFNELAWGQLRSIKKVCQQRKSNWFGHHSDKWIEEIDKVLNKETKKSAYIKVIGLLGVMADCQEC